MKICVLQPDYSTANLDYSKYDPPRNLQSLLPADTVHHVSLNKLNTYKQLKELSGEGYDIFVNLCEGYLDWPVPSIEVPYFLEMLKLPFTGPEARIYDPSKELMKYVAYTVGVNTPAYVVLKKGDDLSTVSTLNFPLFVKPAKAGDSLGIDEDSLVHDATKLQEKAGQVIHEFEEAMVEEYIEGREFTVLVAAHGSGGHIAYPPVEYIFPGDYHFKTYALKTRELHPDANVPCRDTGLETSLKVAAIKVFKAFEGVGYARLDFRVDENGSIFFLEINFTCSVFYTGGYEGSADYILNNSAGGAAGFLQTIIREGLSRYEKRKIKYKVKGNSTAGYGIFATVPIHDGEVIFLGEGKAQRLITRDHMEDHWTVEEQENFRRYAYPVGKDVFLLWDVDPAEWAPQNHSCDPNTKFDGLDVLATRDIGPGVELTLDYTRFLDENMQPFECHCGAVNCRKWIEIKPS